MGCLDSNPGFGFAVRAGGRGSGDGLGIGASGADGGEAGRREGCALIGLGAKVGDIHRPWGYRHWDVLSGFEMGIFSWRGDQNPNTQTDGHSWSTGWIRLVRVILGLFGRHYVRQRSQLFYARIHLR